MPLPHWFDQDTINRLLEDRTESVPEALLWAGKALRTPTGDVNLRANLRSAVPRLLGREFFDVQDSAQVLATTADELLAAIIAEQPGIDAAGEADAATQTMALALIRDDLQSLFHGIAAAVSNAANADLDALGEEQMAVVEEVYARVSDICEAVDLSVDQHLSMLMKFACSVEPPQELISMISAGETPWWIELADPRARAGWSVSAPPVFAALHTMAAAAGAVKKQWEVQGGSTLTLVVKPGEAPQVVLNLVGPPPEEPPQLAWVAKGCERVVELVHFAGQAYESKDDADTSSLSNASVAFLIVANEWLTVLAETTLDE